MMEQSNFEAPPPAAGVQMDVLAVIKRRSPIGHVHAIVSLVGGELLA